MVNTIESMQKEIERLNKEINKLQKNQSNQERQIDSQYTLLNKIFLNYELKPIGVLKQIQELTMELLIFVAKICEKHDLEWWMDYGFLLGAIRHKNYIPWDDDIDIAMMRKDYLKLSEVIEDEIRLNNLDNILGVSDIRKVKEGKVALFKQVKLTHNKALYAGLDIFPKDFIKNPPKDIKELFAEERDKFHDKMIKGENRDEALNEVYETLNLSLERQDFIITGIEMRPTSFRLYDFDTIFPLKKTEFMGRMLPCPHDSDQYLVQIYKDYANIPKRVRVHKRVDTLKQKPNVNENFNVLIEKLKEINNNFLY